MFKTIIIAILSLSFIACSPKVTPQVEKPQIKEQVIEKKHKHTHKKEMFQTVSPEEARLVQDTTEKHSCSRCGMNLVKFYKTNHVATYNNKPIQYCSIHCLAEHVDEGNELKNPMVVDVTSLTFIPVLEAHYVVGSKVRGTMSKVSKYAFKNIEDAKKFQSEHGGKILDFYGALEVAREDFN